MENLRKELYFELFSAISVNEQDESVLSALSCSKGSRYKGDLMVIGRAANGSEKGYTSKEFKDESNKIELLESIIENNEPIDYCPMKWVQDRWGVNQYGGNLKRSQFWRVVYSTLLGLIVISEDTEDWPSFVAYTNLYKMSPADGGNPSEYICDLQFNCCQKILVSEIKELMPSKILFLTGWNWANIFLERMNIQPAEYKDNYVDWSGWIRLENKLIATVIATHPQGKPQAKLVQEVLTAFENLYD